MRIEENNPSEESKKACPPPFSDKELLPMLKTMERTAPTEEIRLKVVKEIEELEKKIAENDE